MNWDSNGFMGVYDGLLDDPVPLPPEDKLKQLRELREERYRQKEEKRPFQTRAPALLNRYEFWIALVD
jgi:hypothetical protein